MNTYTISIFANKIFFEIIKEIKLFSKFKIKHYEDLDLCTKEAKKENIYSNIDDMLSQSLKKDEE